MDAVFFEVRPHPGHLEHYFARVDALRPVLARHTGLVWIDRYTARSEPGVLLSHQLWLDEAAIRAWHSEPEHGRAQAAGKREHFSDYRIRVGTRIALAEAGAVTVEAPAPATGPVTGYLVAAYRDADPAPAGYASVNRAGAFVTLHDAADAAAAVALLRRLAGRPGVTGAAAFGIRRDYGIGDRMGATG
jgi:heme-degrading monooxygenase HmoA